MELSRFNVPEITTITIKFNGEEITIPSTFDEVILEGLPHALIVKLYSYVNDGEMHVLAMYDIEESDDINAETLLGRESCFDLYDGFDVDEVVEQFLEPCRD